MLGMLQSVANNVEYKVIYRSYSHRELSGSKAIGRFREVHDVDESKVMSEAQSVIEAKDWSDNLNAFAKEGFAVKNSGTLQMFDNIVFWALLEKALHLSRIQP